MYIIYYHCSDLKGHGVFKNTEIKACTLLYLLQAIDQCVAVHVELARSLGNIEIILKKPIDRQSYLRQRIPESLPQISLSENFHTEETGDGR